MPVRLSHPCWAALVLAAGLTLTACAPGESPGATATAEPARSASASGTDEPTGDTFGWVEGAVEMTEPPLRLAVVAPDGTTTGIDLLTGDPVDLPDLPAPTAVSTDGRYLFATSAAGLTVLDGGAWTVPHGDHSHYYLAEPRLVGEIDGAGATATTSRVAVIDPQRGTATVVDGAALGAGTVVPVAELTDVPADGVLIPLGDHLVQTVAGVPDAAPDTVRVLDGAGAPVAGAEIACRAAAGSITSRVGVVVGCADGAVLAVADAEGGGPVTLEHVAYPAAASEAERATLFRARKDRPVVAAVAGDRGAWILDTRARTWSLLETDEPLVAVTAVDDRDHAVVAVDRSGRILVLDAETGAVTGTTEPLLAATLADPALAGAVTLEVDAARAYVNDPAGRRVLEIDHGDGARISREFPTPTVPMFFAELGR